MEALFLKILIPTEVIYNADSILTQYFPFWSRGVKNRLFAIVLKSDRNFSKDILLPGY